MHYVSDYIMMEIGELTGPASWRRGNKTKDTSIDKLRKRQLKDARLYSIEICLRGRGCQIRKRIDCLQSVADMRCACVST